MSTYHFKTKPFKHQLEALRKLLHEPAKEVGGSLPMEMGTGKSKVAIDYACILEQLDQIVQVLVLCPIDALGVWNLQVLQHSPSDTLRWKVINYDRTYRYNIQRRGAPMLEIDNLTPLLDYIKEGATLLVLDEGDELANPQSKRSKAAFILSQYCVRTLNMTGTPIRKNPLDLFAQYRAIDEGILGGSWGIFKRTYGVWGGYHNNQLIKHMNMKQLFTRIEPYTYACQLADCMDMPRKMAPEIIPVRMDESKRLYDKFASEAILEFEGIEFEAPHILARLIRLRQMTGGWLVGAEGKRRIGHEKERTLRAKLEQMYRGDVRKVVIYCNFLDDMRTVAEVCKSVGYHVIPFWGGLKRSQRERFIAHFDEIQKPTVWLSQSRTGTRSIPLTAAHHTIYYSLTDRYGAFEQSMARTWRIGQKYPCWYGVMVMENSVDEAVWLSLRTKKSLAKLVYENPELIQ